MPNYELTYVLRPLEEANFTSTNDRINTILKNAGGEIVARNDWGRRRLAYPIQKINDGYYTTLYVVMPGTAIRGLERALQLNDDILRYLVVRVEEFRLPTPAPAPADPTAAVAGTTPPSAAPAPSATPAPEAAAEPIATEPVAAEMATTPVTTTAEPAAPATETPVAPADTTETAPAAVSSTAPTEGS